MTVTREEVRQSIFDLTHYWDDTYGVGNWGDISQKELDNCPQFAILNSKGAWEVTNWVDLNDAKSNSMFYVNDDDLANAPAWIKAVEGQSIK